MWPGMKDYIKLTECENEHKDMRVCQNKENQFKESGRVGGGGTLHIILKNLNQRLLTF